MMQPPIQQQMIKFRIVWFSILMAVVLVTFVAFKSVTAYVNDPINQARIALEAEIKSPGAESFNNVILYVAFFVGVLSFVLPRFLKKLVLNNVIKSGQPVTVVSLENLFFQPRVVSWALAEAPSIFGFVVATMTHELHSTYLLSGYSTVLLMLHFPRSLKIEDLARLGIKLQN